MFDSKPFIQRLKSYMKEHDVTQGELAKRIGTSGPTFSRWLNGRTTFNPSLNQLLNMAETFGVTLVELLSMEKTKASASRSTKKQTAKASAAATATATNEAPKRKPGRPRKTDTKAK